MLIALAVILLLGLRKLLSSEQRTSPGSRSSLLLVGYLMLSVPVILFVLSHLITPIFVTRYMLPSGIGLAIVLTDFADARDPTIRPPHGWHGHVGPVSSSFAGALVVAYATTFLKLANSGCNAIGPGSPCEYSNRSRLGGRF